jgi:hypothetical protein
VYVIVLNVLDSDDPSGEKELSLVLALAKYYLALLPNASFICRCIPESNHVTSHDIRNSVNENYLSRQ